MHWLTFIAEFVLVWFALVVFVCTAAWIADAVGFAIRKLFKR